MLRRLSAVDFKHKKCAPLVLFDPHVTRREVRVGPAQYAISFCQQVRFHQQPGFHGRLSDIEESYPSGELNHPTSTPRHIHGKGLPILFNHDAFTIQFSLDISVLITFTPLVSLQRQCMFFFPPLSCQYSSCQYSSCQYTSCQYTSCQYTSCQFTSCQYRSCQYTSCQYSLC